MDGSIGRGLEDYLVAVTTAVVAAILTALLWPLPASSPLILFYAAVAAAAWRGGLGPSLAATAFSALAGAYFFLAPYGSFQPTSESSGSVFVFVCAASLLGWLVASRRNPTARRRWIEEFVERLPEGAAVINAAGGIAHLNPIAERLTGWSRDEARGEPFGAVFRMLDERTRERRDPVAGVLAAGEGANPRGRLILVSKDGGEISVSVSAAPIPGPHGAVAGGVLVVHADSAREPAEEDPRGSRDLDRKIIDASDVCVKLLDLDGRILSINEYGARLLEMDDPNEWVGRSLAEDWPEEAREALRDAIRRAALGERVRFVSLARTVKGAPKWWDFSIAPILDAGGRPEKLLGVGRDVTERKLAEDALRASQERYRTLFNAIDEGVCIAEVMFDDQGRPSNLSRVEANPAFERLLGLSKVEGRTFRDLVAEGGRGKDYCLEILGRVAQTGEPARFTNLAPTLHQRWLDVHAFRFGEEGSRKVAALLTDITGVVLAERERGRLVLSLENERAQMARIIEKAPAYIAILRGPNHVYEFANAEYRRAVGRRPLIGRPIAEAVPELKAYGVFERLDRVYQTGEDFIGRERPFLIAPAGTGEPAKRVANMVLQALRDPDGSITGVFIHGVDVTEIAQAAEAVKESEARYRELADAMPQAVWTADPSGRLEFCNRSWLEYTGFQEKPVPVDARTRIIHPDDLEHVDAACARAINSGERLETEFRFRRASDGAFRWHLSRALPIRNENGEIVRWIGTNTDIDDFKRLSEALKAADRRKDEFLATLAHELRNPLAPIRTGLQILGRKLNEEVFASTVEMMSRQLGHVTRMIDDLLDAARVGGGKITLRWERVTLRSAVGAALEASRSLIETKRHELKVTLAEEPIWLSADPTRLTQVISNLLTNAAKYTDPGGRISVSTERRGGEGVLWIKDTGEGIAPEMLPRIFDMFNQVDSSSARSEGGLGIGLTVVKRLVELHGGRIEARSEGLGRGSEFIVRLPLADDDAEPAALAPQGSRPDVEAEGVGGNG